MTAIVATSPVAASAAAPTTRRAFVRQIMGMPISVHVRATDARRPDIAAGVERVFAHLARVDRVLSTWRADSGLLRLQHREVAPGDEVDAWIAEVTDLCLTAEERTDGLFSAWRARAGGRPTYDPTGLVKGWGVAGAAAHLEIVSEIAWSIGAGGDVLCGVGRGMAGQEPLWRIGIEDPRERGRIVDTVTVSRGAVATSGAAARGTHISDPRTGKALGHHGSVTVAGPDLVWADVWATAAFVDPGLAGRLLEVRDPAYQLRTHL